MRRQAGWEGQLLIFAFKWLTAGVSQAERRRSHLERPGDIIGAKNVVDVMCKMCRAGHQLENRVVIAREALRILALGVLSVMDDIEPKRRRRDLGAGSRRPGTPS